MKTKLKTAINLCRFARFTPKPRALIFFVTSACNGRCGHCFYWRNLNQKQDLSYAEIQRLSQEIGQLDYLMLSGGEPFLREDLVEICALFFRNNHPASLHIPTNGLNPLLIAQKTSQILKIAFPKPVYLNLSLEGPEAVHDRIRGVKGGFQKLYQSYQQLRRLKEQFSNLRLKLNTTVSNQNLESLFGLIQEIPVLFPNLDGYHLALLRGEPLERDFQLPKIEDIQRLFEYKNQILKPPLLERLLDRVTLKARIKAIQERRQPVPCEAGRLLGVVEEDGDIRHCELLPKMGNIKKQGFREIWQGQKSREARAKIEKGECFCTHECFLFPSLLAHPLSFLKYLF